jgi:CRISPR/Cas system-associated exonuclease Cas4 (RecB family)
MSMSETYPALPPPRDYVIDKEFKEMVDRKKIPYQGKRDSRGHDASSITDCPRALWYRWKGYPRPPESRADFQTNRGMIGKAVEYGIIRWFSYATGLRAEQSYHFDREWGVGGSVDVVIPLDGQEIPLEIKSVDTYTNSGQRTTDGPKDDAFYQLQIYLWLMGAPYGYLIYYDIAKVERWWAFRVMPQPDAIDWIKARIRLLDAIYAKDVPPARPVDNPMKYWRCNFCPYIRPCWLGTAFDTSPRATDPEPVELIP